MKTPASIHKPLKKGDRVSYYIKRKVSTDLHSTRIEQVRRNGIVQGWRDGKVVVLHAAGYTETIADPDLYLVD